MGFPFHRDPLLAQTLNINPLLIPANNLLRGAQGLPPLTRARARELAQEEDSGSAPDASAATDIAPEPQPLSVINNPLAVQVPPRLPLAMQTEPPRFTGRPGADLKHFKFELTDWYEYELATLQCTHAQVYARVRRAFPYETRPALVAG